VRSMHEASGPRSHPRGHQGPNLRHRLKGLKCVRDLIAPNARGHPDLVSATEWRARCHHVVIRFHVVFSKFEP
jgi:hypothetical protein